jgi:hypothetical protein
MQCKEHYISFLLFGKRKPKLLAMARLFSSTSDYGDSKARNNIYFSIVWYGHRNSTKYFLKATTTNPHKSQPKGQKQLINNI